MVLLLSQNLGSPLPSRLIADLVVITFSPGRQRFFNDFELIKSGHKEQYEQYSAGHVCHRSID
jgi:hypothetical protein